MPFYCQWLFQSKQQDDLNEIDTKTQWTLNVGGSITVHLVYSLTRLDLTNKKTWLFVCGDAVEANLVKLEISHTVILPITLSVPTTTIYSFINIFAALLEYLSFCLRPKAQDLGITWFFVVLVGFLHLIYALSTPTTMLPLN